MSVGLVTSETQALDFHPAMDPEAKSCAVETGPIADLGSIVKLKSNGFFSSLSEPSIRTINQIAQFGRHPADTIIYFEGDMARGVYILYEGRAEVLTTNTDGKTRILKIALPGDVLGLNSVLAGTSHEVTVKTTHPCQFAFIARGAFLKFVKEQGDACLYFAQHLSRDCHAAYDVIRSMGTTVEKRLARFLMSCCANGCVNEGIVQAKLVLTHEAISQRIGCSRETVSRVLSDFKRRRVAELDGTALLVYDRAVLQSLSAI
jgi:CRP/FNR family transcriptional regulator, cyclic AMP receptor protein